MRNFTLRTALDRDRLIEEYAGYARALALKLQRVLHLPAEDVEELTAAAALGLVEAAEKFDPLRGVAFSTFAYYRIRGAMFDAIRHHQGVSRGHKRVVQVTASVDDLLESLDGDEQATATQRPRSVDEDIDRVSSMIDELIPVFILSLEDAHISPTDPSGESFSHELENEELCTLTRSLIKGLSAGDQEILVGLYFRNLSMTELATELGVGKSWISRLHIRALRNLRALMEHQGILSTPAFRCK